MQLEDIPAVMKVERESFKMPWPGNAYKRELKENKLARYIVARRTGPPLAGDLDVQPEGVAAPIIVQPQGWRRRFSRWLTGADGDARSETKVLSRRVIGYAGLWLMVDEAHVTSIAVAPPYRGFGIGELMLLGMFDISREIGAHYLTLEVRVSNAVAQGLYHKYGFKEAGVRRRYYSDDNEDALIMWSDPLDAADYVSMIDGHRRDLMNRLRPSQVQPKLRSRVAQP
jgi:ribosomal-protein-alanine N-acetyltransferase